MRPTPPVDSDATGLAPVTRMRLEDRLTSRWLAKPRPQGTLLRPPSTVVTSDVRCHCRPLHATCRPPPIIARACLHLLQRKLVKCGCI